MQGCTKGSPATYPEAARLEGWAAGFRPCPEVALAVGDRLPAAIWSTSFRLANYPPLHFTLQEIKTLPLFVHLSGPEALM